jgi:Icc-related predicted phosphoesterase
MKRLLTYLLLSIVALSCLAQNAPAALDSGVKSSFSFDAYGDIRFMNPSDTKDSDPLRRKMIVAKIAEDKPAFLLITGDVVANGGDGNQWKVFDRETAPLRDAEIKIYPALGNHDLRGDLPVALSNYFERFPYLDKSRYYTVRAGNVLIITLDSSLDHPGGEEMQWFDKQIDSLPKEVEFVVVQLHHPPLTRSRDGMFGGGHSPRGQEGAMAKLLESRQAKTQARFVVVAGHVHNYERYEEGGVMFITTGGGGATPYMIQREPDDAYKDHGPTYHFCHFDVEPGKLTMHMEKLELDGNKPKWTERDSFELKAK